LDIGVVSENLFGSKKCLTDNNDKLKQKVLTAYLFVPNERFTFPLSNNRKFQLRWLKDFQWLAYSKINDGAYCKYCVLFAQGKCGKGNQQKMGCLVATPFKKWKNALEKFRDHAATGYHKVSTHRAENFIKTDSGK